MVEEENPGPYYINDDILLNIGCLPNGCIFYRIYIYIFKYQES